MSRYRSGFGFIAGTLSKSQLLQRTGWFEGSEDLLYIALKNMQELQQVPANLRIVCARQLGMLGEYWSEREAFEKAMNAYVLSAQQYIASGIGKTGNRNNPSDGPEAKHNSVIEERINAKLSLAEILVKIGDKDMAREQLDEGLIKFVRSSTTSPDPQIDSYADTSEDGNTANTPTIAVSLVQRLIILLDDLGENSADVSSKTSGRTPLL